MYVELHMLQNFAPSNLNRDDTGSPKDCEFGGVRRARISSQCLKRATRRSGEFSRAVAGLGGVRTRRLIIEIAERLTTARPVPESVVKLVSSVFAEGGIERPKVKQGSDEEKDNTKLIVFMDSRALDSMANAFKARWESLNSGNTNERDAVREELGRILVESVRVPDIALFGRMLEIEEKKPFGKLQLNVDPACQVAHAISTNKVSVEFDFFTAVDDLQPLDESGAGMMGTVEFNSACFYRYANVDLRQLRRNLGDNAALAERTIEAFIRALVAAIPTGKQTSMAAQNPPSLVMAVVRDSGLWSLANAFQRPVRPTEFEGLIERSIAALDAHWGKLTRMYGERGIVDVSVVQAEDVQLHHLAEKQVDSVELLVQRVLAAVTAGVTA